MPKREPPDTLGLCVLSHPYSPQEWDDTLELQIAAVRRNVRMSQNLTEDMTRLGATVIPLLALSDGLEGAADYRGWMRRCFLVIRAVALAGGCMVVPQHWQTSRGCRREVRYARLLGMPVAVCGRWAGGVIAWL